MNAAATTLGRILIAVLFILAGVGKVMDPASTAAYIEAESPLPGSLAIVVGAFELLAGLVLASSYFTRIASLSLAGFTLLATVLFHENLADQLQLTMALKNLAVIGGLLVIYAQGDARAKPAAG